MPAHVMQFDSVGALLACVEQTRQGDTWRRYATHQGSTDSFAEMIALSDAVTMARTLHGLEEEITTIDTLASTMAALVQAPASVKRVPTWGRSGTRISINKVMRGNLQQAWRTTTRQATAHRGRVLTLIVPCNFSAGVPESQIRLTCAASLAYAALCAQAGYSLDVWACMASGHLWAAGADGLTMIRLLAAGEAWQTQGVALAAHAAFLRRLVFRAWEATIPRRGPLAVGYGAVHKQGALQQAVARWAKTRAIDTGTLAYGAFSTDRLTTPAAAQAWLTQHLTALAA